MKKLTPIYAGILSTVFVLGGCSDDGDDVTVQNIDDEVLADILDGGVQRDTTTDLIVGPYSFSSIVINAEGKEPISGVTATLQKDGATNVLSDTSAATNDDLTNGAISFNDLEFGRYVLTLEKEGFSTRQFFVTFDSEGAVGGFVGDIELAPAGDLKVLVSDGENYLSDVPVYLWQRGPDTTRCEAVYPQLTEKLNDKVIASAADGYVTFTGLSECHRYELYIPAQDTDNDGIFDLSGYGNHSGNNYDYDQFQIDYGYNPYYSNAIDITLVNDFVHLVLKEIDDEADAIVAYSSFEPIKSTIIVADDHRSDLHYMSSQDEITLAFDRPIELISSVLAENSNVLISQSDENYGVESSIELESELDATKSILKVKAPAEGYAEGTIFGLHVEYQDLDSTEEAESETFSRDIYITKAGDPSVTADFRCTYRYNRCDESELHLQFSEVVTGSIDLVSVKKPGGEFMPANFYGDGNSRLEYVDSDCFSDASSDTPADVCGTSDLIGISFYRRYSLNYWASQVVEGDIIKVELDIEDLDGNAIKGTRVITVQ